LGVGVFIAFFVRRFKETEELTTYIHVIIGIIMKLTSSEDASSLLAVVASVLVYPNHRLWRVKKPVFVAYGSMAGSA
jgi:hypothetical protein